MRTGDNAISVILLLLMFRSQSSGTSLRELMSVSRFSDRS